MAAVTLDIPDALLHQASALGITPKPAPGTVAPQTVADTTGASNTTTEEGAGDTTGDSEAPGMDPEAQGADPALEAGGAGATGGDGTEAAGATDPFEQAIAATNASLETEQQAQSDATAEKNGLGGRIWDAVGSAGVGIMMGGINTANAFGDMIGLPPSEYDKRAPIMNDIIGANAELGRRSGVNAFIGGTAAFVTGMLGVGKFADGIKLGGWAANSGKIISTLGEFTKGATAAGLVFDPHAGRLSDMIQSVPALRNPLTSYLSSDPTDSNAEGRFKNALEGAGMDVVMAGTFGAAMKLYKFVKVRAAGGKAAEVVTDDMIQEASTALSEQVAKAKEAAGGGTLPEGRNILTDTAQQGPSNAPDLGQNRSLPPAQNILIGGTPGKVEYGGRQALKLAEGLNEGTMRPGETPKPKLKGPDPVGDALHPEPGKPQLPKGENAIDITIRGGKDSPPQLQEGAPKLPNADLTQPEKLSVPETQSLGEAIRVRAKGEGQKIARQPGTSQIEQKIADQPKIETNGIGYKLISHEDMVSLGKGYGIDTSRWYAAANRKTGEIWVSRRVLSLPPAKQQEIIMHETGHALESSFFERVTGKKGASVKELDPKLRTQMEAASQKFRPDHWNNAKKQSQTKWGKDAIKYLKSPEELFADNFAMWKLRREEFGQLAPDLARDFDQHFAPWIDHDFTQTAGDIAAALDHEELAAGRANNAGTLPKQRSTDNFVRPAPVRANYVDDIVEQAAKDMDALDKFGTKEAAEAAGHRFGKANLPYQKLVTPGGLEHFMAQVSERLKARLDLLKGGDVLHDKRVEAVVKQRMELFNEDGAAVMGMLQQAGRNAASMVSHMEAAFLIANKAAMDLDQLVKNNRMGNYAEFGGDANAAEAALAPRLALYIEALGAAQSIRSNAGRAMRRLRGDFQLDEATINMVRKLDPDAVSTIVDMAGGNRKMLAKLATKGFWDRWVRAAGSLYSNNLLWLWPSHVRNTLGNSFMLMVTPAMRAVGSFAVREGGQDIRIAALREYRYMLSSTSDAFEFAKAAWLKGDSIMNPHQNEYFRSVGGDSNVAQQGAVANAVGLRPMKTVGDFFHNMFASMSFTVGQPNRTLGMADEFIKQMSYRGTVLAKASVEADHLGLTGKAYQEHLEAVLDAAFDANGLALDKQALYDAQVKTFSQPLLQGTLGQSISNVVGAHPMLRFFLPFVRTPINLFRYSTKLTPGLNMLQKEFRENILGAHGPQLQADAFGQMAMGSLLLATGVSLSLAGLITGGGPSDPQHAAALKQTGWKPYSVRVNNPDGSHTYIPFNNLDPLGMQLSFIGDITQVAQQGLAQGTQWYTMLAGGAISMAKNFANRTYLQSISDLVGAISEPDANMERVMGSLASNMIPMSSLMREVNPDPYMRDARSIQQQVMATLPGFSDKVPPRRDVFGDPVYRTNNLVFTDKASTIADAEQQRLLTEYGVGLTPTPAKMRGGVDLRTFVLKATGQPAYDEYARLIGHPTGFKDNLKQAVGKMIQSKAYAGLPEGGGEVKGSKLWALQRILDAYRTAAYKELIKANPDLALTTGMQQQAQRAAFREAQMKAKATEVKTNATVANQLEAFNASVGQGNK